MKAVIYNSSATETLGAADATIPKPEPQPGQVLVQIHAAALNPVDYKLTGFPIVSWSIQGRPVCMDFAGVVSAVAPGVTSLQAGDEVYGTSTKGTLAEFQVTEASKVALKPKNLSFEEAASLPIVALTSLQSLVKGNVSEGKRVLILGASGGCGAVGVQIAKAMKAHVTAVCSAKNAEKVKEHGADVVHDYNLGDPPKDPPFDCIYDTVTSPEDTNYQPLRRTHLANGGTYVGINGFGSDWIKHFLSPYSFGLLTSSLHVAKHSGEDLARLRGWAESGDLRPQVQQLLPFSAAGWKQGVEILKSRRATGKLVFKVV